MTQYHSIDVKLSNQNQQQNILINKNHQRKILNIINKK